MIKPKNAIFNKSEQGLAVSFQLESDLDYFSGHFDKKPVLAGVVQIGWIVEWVQEHYATKLNFCGFKNIKFTDLVIPPCALCIDINYQPDNGHIRFSSLKNGLKCASGIIMVSTS